MIGFYDVSALLAAFILDLIFGDPARMPHPVRWIGRGIHFSENFWRERVVSEFWAGAGMTLSLVFGVGLVSYYFLESLEYLGSFFYWMGSVVIIYFCISVKSLAQEATGIFDRLSAGNIELAREKLSGIVGRDTEPLEADAIVRATVESVSENFVDGFLSPVFFALVGGPAAALVYKTVNTLDSMVGYKIKRYLHFGKFAARLDDFANYIPARLSVFPVFLSALLYNKSPLKSVKVFLRDGRKHSSPNSGYPEAAFAGALKIRLGGPSYYGGVLVEKPFIGDPDIPIEDKHIMKGVYLMVLASCVTVAGCVLSALYLTI